MPKTLRLLLPAILVAATVLPAASTSATASAPAAAATAISWGRCAQGGPQLQCAKLTVPLNWSQPGGKHIQLAITRRLATDQKHLIGSMYVNPGGPGESGVELVRDAGGDLNDWGGGRFNIVSWDPRGTNDSDPVRCFTSAAAEAAFWRGVQIPTTAAASPAYARKTAELARRCGQVSGALLDNISTADSARDLDALRAAVGDSTITYVGLSYGTFIGETYANMFPGRVRAMMLDALIYPVAYTQGAEARFQNSVGSADAVFAQFVALCQGAGPDKCALANHPGTVRQRVDALFDRVRRSPIPAPHANPPGVLDYSDLLLTTFTPLRDPNSWTEYAKELDAAANGDASALETAARPSRTPEAFTKATTSAAIQCLDGPARQPVSAWPTVIANLTRASHLWGPILGWWQWAPCAANWPGHANDRYAGPWNAKTKNPILLVNNVYDPATGYANAQRDERLLGNAVLLTVAGYGHPSYQLPSKCTDDARTRYLVKLITPKRGTVCQAQAPFHG